MRFPLFLLASLGLLGLARGAATAPVTHPAAANTQQFALRVESDGFNAAEADIRAVIDSAARELGRYFPGHTIEPMVVVHAEDGPITLFQRNGQGEIVIRLSTSQTYWCQYAYQFAHELGHVLCGYRNTPSRNKWFEETMCETAALFAMRRMARTWRDTPPYPNWAPYRDALNDYVDDVIGKRVGTKDIFRVGLPAFYVAHKAELEADATSRELNGAMSVVLLRLLEEQPENWEAFRWLNTTPATAEDGFQIYLQKWHDAAPDAHRAFIRSVAELFGIPLNPPSR